MRHTPDAVHVMMGRTEVGRVPGRVPGQERGGGDQAAPWRPDESGGGGRSSELGAGQRESHAPLCLCRQLIAACDSRADGAATMGAFRGIPRDPPGGLWQRLSAPRGPSPPDGRPPRRVFRWKGVWRWPTGTLRGFRRSRRGMGNRLDRLAPRLSPSPPPLTPEIGFGEYGVPKY